ncbi:hypothetical protein EP7_005301 [Isosphaeraceae bacterium EP7]
MVPITRRSVLQSAGAAGLAGVVTGSRSASADEPATASFKTRFRKPKIVKPRIAELGDLPATNISPDGLAITILFDKAMELSLSDGEDLVTSLTASLLIPVSVQEPSAETFRGYSAFVRGFINKEKGTRVLLTLDLGETHDVADFPYGEVVSDDFVRPVFSYPVSELKREKPGGGTETIQVTPAPHFSAILTLTIQRHSPKDRATIKIDSLDVEIVDPSKTPSGGAETPATKKGQGEYGRAKRSR